MCVRLDFGNEDLPWSTRRPGYAFRHIWVLLYLTELTGNATYFCPNVTMKCLNRYLTRAILKIITFEQCNSRFRAAFLCTCVYIFIGRLSENFQENISGDRSLSLLESFLMFKCPLNVSYSSTSLVHCWEETSLKREEEYINRASGSLCNLRY